MEWSHFISDGVLTLVGFFVFFRYLSGLDLDETLLWESFVLSVTAAALFGTLNFAGLDIFGYASSFFQRLAATAGAVGLLAITWCMAVGYYPKNIATYIILVIGFILFGLVEVFNINEILEYTPLVCLPLVAIAGVVGLIRGLSKFGLYTIVAVAFLALSVFRSKFITDVHDGIDAYHYLLAIAIRFLGLAAYSVKRKAIS